MVEPEGFPKKDKYGDFYRSLEKSASWTKRFSAVLRRNITLGLWNIVFTRHGEQRMEQRNVVPHEVKSVLLTGRWKESRLYTARPEHERHVFEGTIDDTGRRIEVVFVIEEKVIVVTVWSERR